MKFHMGDKVANVSLSNKSIITKNSVKIQPVVSIYLQLDCVYHKK